MLLPIPEFLHNGYTLIELMVVFALVILISSVGFASYSSYAQHQAVNQAADDVKLAFTNAQFNALSQVKPSQCGSQALQGYIVKLGSPDPSSYEIVADCAPNYPTAEVKHLPGGVSFSDTYSSCSGVEYSTLSHVVSLPSPIESECAFDVQLGNSIKKTLTVHSNGTVDISP